MCCHSSCALSIDPPNITPVADGIQVSAWNWVERVESRFTTSVLLILSEPGRAAPGGPVSPRERVDVKEPPGACAPHTGAHLPTHPQPTGSCSPGSSEAGRPVKVLGAPCFTLPYCPQRLCVSISLSECFVLICRTVESTLAGVLGAWLLYPASPDGQGGIRGSF